MSDGFDALIDESNLFFAQLAANNTKDWFEPRKDRYKDGIKGPAELLGNLLAEDISRASGKAHAPKLFRIYRDVRFSKDKTPYNTHLHLMFSQGAEGKPVWFFGSSPSYLLLGMGLPALKGEALTTYRAFVDRSGDALRGAMDRANAAIGADLSDWGPEPLKRVPKPYAPEHPHAGLLKRKSLALSADFPSDWRDTGVLSNAAALCASLMPIWELLDQEFGEQT